MAAVATSWQSPGQRPQYPSGGVPDGSRLGRGARRPGHRLSADDGEHDLRSSALIRLEAGAAAERCGLCADDLTVRDCAGGKPAAKPTEAKRHHTAEFEDPQSMPYRERVVIAHMSKFVADDASDLFAAERVKQARRRADCRELWISSGSERIRLRAVH